MRNFYQSLADLARAGTPVAVATIIQAKGSTPREVGAKMVVRGEGLLMGTVGGGCGEAQVLWDAVRVLEQGPPMISQVDLTGELSDRSQTNCGGIMDVFIDRMRWEEPAAVGLPARETVEVITDAAAKREGLVLATVVGGQGRLQRVPAGSKWIVHQDGRLLGTLEDPALRAGIVREAAAALAAGQSRRVHLDDDGVVVHGPERDQAVLDLFLEVLAAPLEVLIVGAGHIAVPLAKMAKLLEFEVTVLDDRASFANRERFPEADRVISGNIEGVLRQYPVGPSTHLVLVTRGHQLDEEALKVVIGKGAAYLGMIGSRRRVKEVFRHLRDAGVPEDLIRRVHAPIGLDIGAETPAEIATAVMGEIVKVRRGGRAQSLSLWAGGGDA